MIEQRKSDRRPSKYIEKVSSFMLVTAAIGGFLILIDPQIVIDGTPGWTLRLGSDGFSSELKGAVVTLMLIGGWTAIKEYWLGASAAGQTQSDTMSRIAEGVPPNPPKPAQPPEGQVNAPSSR